MDAMNLTSPKWALPEWSLSLRQFAIREWGPDALGRRLFRQHRAETQEQHAYTIACAVGRGEPVPAELVTLYPDAARTRALVDARAFNRWLAPIFPAQ